jgi:hypothetical protein
MLIKTTFYTFNALNAQISRQNILILCVYLVHRVHYLIFSKIKSFILNQRVFTTTANITSPPQILAWMQSRMILIKQWLNLHTTKYKLYMKHDEISDVYDESHLSKEILKPHSKRATITSSNLSNTRFVQKLLLMHEILNKTHINCFCRENIIGRTNLCKFFGYSREWKSKNSEKVITNVNDNQKITRKNERVRIVRKS